MPQLQFVGKPSTSRVVDFAVSTGSRKSPVDLHFEELGSDTSRHFDAKNVLEMQDFA